jgi:hypothetical protein
MTSPYIDVQAIVSQVLPMISAFISMFLVIWIFKSFLGVFKELRAVA